jgi:hypothetical protein
MDVCVEEIWDVVSLEESVCVMLVSTSWFFNSPKLKEGVMRRYPSANLREEMAHESSYFGGFEHF